MRIVVALRTVVVLVALVRRRASVALNVGAVLFGVALGPGARATRSATTGTVGA